VGSLTAGLLGAIPFLAALLFAALVSTTLTPLIARYAKWRGLVVQPRADRWHRKPTPILGGVAMSVAVLLVLATALPQTPTFAVLILCVAGAAVLGLLDDLRGLAPTTKLAGQAIIASLLVAGGIRVELVTFEPAAFVLTVGWIVALMNAVNLIDNMDGLAAGIAVIGGVALAVTALPTSLPAAILAGTTAGAALGFLVHNFSPAKVFMGDAGSMLLGFLLATAALLGTTAATTNVAIAVFAPLAVLALPIFDTALVSASRGLAGLPLSRGGRDHVSHRLVALGLTERRSVLLLYALAAILATLAIAAEFASGLFLPLLVLGGIALALFGVYLSEVNPYGGDVRRVQGNAVARAIFRYVRFGSEILLDVALLTVAYYSSYLLRFEEQLSVRWLADFGWSLPVLISFQLGALVVFRVYRTLWRYIGVGDALSVLRALAVANILGFIAIALVEPSGPPSRAVFILDWLVASLLVVGARSLLVWLRQTFARLPRQGERSVIIIGASDIGELAHRLLAHQEGASYRTIGFLDDDRGKHYRQIGGVPVLGATTELQSIARRLKPDLILDTGAGSPGKVRETCRELDIEWRPFAIPALTTLENKAPAPEAVAARDVSDAARQWR
jgi:UDP-GlcNAc:undecaprenyl-phosphate/decaprenyl-phosphate GlcNAc-1-phosphate transferase